MLRFTVTAMVTCLLSGCVTLRSANLTNLSVPREKGHAISGESSTLVFLGLNFSNEYAFAAREKLYASCENGIVTGVLSTYDTTNYILFTRHRVRAEATCALDPNKADSPADAAASSMQAELPPVSVSISIGTTTAAVGR